jgi:hypothetical protein
MFFKTLFKRVLEFILAIVGTILAIALLISFGGLTTSLASMRVLRNWTGTLELIAFSVLIWLLFYVVEQYLWPSTHAQSIEVVDRKGVRIVLIVAIVPVVLIGFAILVAGIVALGADKR